MSNNSVKGLAVIISSPSGVGKTTISKELLKFFKSSKLSISCTTREPRKNELNGKDYYFVSKKKFNFLKKNNSFIETAKVYNNYYGTLKREVVNNLNKNKIIILDVDWQGARSIKKILKKNCISFYLIPPSLKELKKRLFKRHKDDKKIAIHRFSKAKNDLKQVSAYDYIIINKKIKICAKEIINNIIFEQKKIKDINKNFNKIKLMIKS